MSSTDSIIKTDMPTMSAKLLIAQVMYVCLGIVFCTFHLAIPRLGLLVLLLLFVWFVAVIDLIATIIWRPLSRHWYLELFTCVFVAEILNHWLDIRGFLIQGMLFFSMILVFGIRMAIRAPISAMK